MQAPVSNAHVTTCVRYLLPGQQEAVREVPGRDPDLAAAAAPGGAYAFTFYAEVTATARIGSEDVVLHSHPFGVSGRYPIGHGALIPTAGPVTP
jgi:hypothetical protein